MIDKSFQTLIISLAIHGILTLALLRSPAPQRAPSPTDVEVVYNTNRPSQRVIIDNLSPDRKDPAERLKEQAENLSRITRRVKEQQVARNQTPSKIANLAPQAATALRKESTQTQEQARGRQNPLLEKDGSRPLAVPGVNAPEPSSGASGDFSKSVVIGGSTQGEWIPGVKEGSFTALNTDQFTYYSFFARIKESIRYRWINGVRNFSQNAAPDEIMALSRIPSPTKLQVSLSRAGEVLKVTVMKTSGSSELDDAAIKAFWAASPLQNPPAEMIDEDGLIRLYYSFQVLWQPQYIATDKK